MNRIEQAEEILVVVWKDASNCSNWGIPFLNTPAARSWLREKAKQINALYIQPESSDLLLTDEEVKPFWFTRKSSYGGAVVEELDVNVTGLLGAQLAKAEPIIRADERKKVLKEVGEMSKVVNPYGDRLIRGCDWQELNGLDFEGIAQKEIKE